MMIWAALIQLALPLMSLLLLPVISFAVCASCVSWFERHFQSQDVSAHEVAVSELKLTQSM
ncbi:hypothetical protein [Shewanella denitrificans]|uniref:hypothetical protein n=1 Tax=Shewanella denitrificans TaxID=192073 RepID=UPI0012F7D1CB|nr:hypothetical protein [Shewanella denitrificans]